MNYIINCLINNIINSQSQCDVTQRHPLKVMWQQDHYTVSYRKLHHITSEYRFFFSCAILTFVLHLFFFFGSIWRVWRIKIFLWLLWHYYTMIFVVLLESHSNRTDRSMSIICYQMSNLYWMTVLCVYKVRRFPLCHPHLHAILSFSSCLSSTQTQIGRGAGMPMQTHSCLYNSCWFKPAQGNIPVGYTSV